MAAEQNPSRVQQSLPQVQQSLPRVRNVQFRVLVIGRANAGKTSILQRVCDTTESPEIYRCGSKGIREKVLQLGATTERGEHDIEDELLFTNHRGYVFHDSRGFESGDKYELKIVQDFVRSKSSEGLLKNRLHAIWYCIPMDNTRPELDLKYFEEVCPDQNVPVIAVFTKYDQFKRDVWIKLEDSGRNPRKELENEAEILFRRHYLAGFRRPPPFVRLERMHQPDQRCASLIEMTANSLSGDIVAIMLLAVQRDNLQLNVKQAIKWVYSAFEQGYRSTEDVIEKCVQAFPSLWVSYNTVF